MGKLKMPTVQHFLHKKIMYNPKKDPVWVYLEKEMIKNIDKKPYNVKVGEWLKFLKDLRYFYYCEAKRKLWQLRCDCGPPWYFELSSQQKEVLQGLRANIHQDLLEDLPVRIRKSLSDLGVTLKIPRNVLMKAMVESVEDPGIFIWKLYRAIYRISPSELRRRYDINAMTLLSCLVFIDLDECIQCLEKLTHFDKPTVVIKKKEARKNFKPNVKFGEYLQKNYIPCYIPHASTKEPRKPLPLGHKFRLRSAKSYEKLCLDEDFLDKRKERNKKSLKTERICTYKFWEPPNSLRHTDKKSASLAEKLKMIKKRAKAKHKAPYKNVQYHVSGVSFTKGTPRFLLSNVAILPTGYIPINGGISITPNGEGVVRIVGHLKFPSEDKDFCETCDCVTQWEDTVLEYMKESRCKCGHLYDYGHEGKSKDKYFYPPTKHQPYYLDQAKIYQLDPMEDFIKDTVNEALLSRTVTAEPSEPTLVPSGLSGSELLAALLADLSNTPLLIPHLPQANRLNNLLEWVRKRVKGKLTAKEDRRLKLQSQRRWCDMKHTNFKALAYRIPFTRKQLENMNWSHRTLVQTLFNILLEDFISRNRLKQLEQTRMWWATTKYDMYPGKAFLDIFFTYMAGRMKDTFLINPYSKTLTPTHGAKTCPL